MIMKMKANIAEWGCVAYIHEDSDSLVWKKKLIQEQKIDTQSQISKLLQFIGELEYFERTLDNHS